MSERLSPEELIALLRGLADGRLIEPPPTVLHQARALAHRLPAPAPSLAERAVALIFDSGLQLASAGVRSGEAGERRLLYVVQDDDARIELDLRLRVLPGAGLEVMGQVLPAPRAASVHLDAGGRARRARIGAEGEFVLRRVRVGDAPLRLEVRGGDGRSFAIESVPLPDES